MVGMMVGQEGNKYFVQELKVKQWNRPGVGDEACRSGKTTKFYVEDKKEKTLRRVRKDKNERTLVAVICVPIENLRVKMYTQGVIRTGDAFRKKFGKESCEREGRKRVETQ
jgi:hypothetical protein